MAGVAVVHGVVVDVLEVVIMEGGMMEGVMVMLEEEGVVAHQVEIRWRLQLVFG